MNLVPICSTYIYQDLPHKWLSHVSKYSSTKVCIWGRYNMMKPEGKPHKIPLNHHSTSIFLWVFPMIIPLNHHIPWFSYVFLYFPMVFLCFPWFSYGSHWKFESLKDNFRRHLVPSRPGPASSASRCSSLALGAWLLPESWTTLDQDRQIFHRACPVAKYRKTMGKPLENHRKTMGTWWLNGVLTGYYRI